MTDKQDHTQSSEAQQALDSIQKMEQAALRRVIPPRWFGATIALLTGSLVTLSAANLREYHVFIILAMALVISYQSHLFHPQQSSPSVVPHVSPFQRRALNSPMRLAHWGPIALGMAGVSS